MFEFLRDEVCFLTVLFLEATCAEMGREEAVSKYGGLTAPRGSVLAF